MLTLFVGWSIVDEPSVSVRIVVEPSVSVRIVDEPSVRLRIVDELSVSLRIVDELSVSYACSGVGDPVARRPSGPAALRPSGPAAQRPSGPAAQRRIQWRIQWGTPLGGGPVGRPGGRGFPPGPVLGSGVTPSWGLYIDPVFFLCFMPVCIHRKFYVLCLYSYTVGFMVFSLLGLGVRGTWMGKIFSVFFSF